MPSWENVRRTYFPEWGAIVGEPDHVYVSRKPRDDQQGIEGAAGVWAPVIVLRASVLKKSRAQRRAVLIHEGSHTIASSDIPQGLGLRSDLIDLLDHGPAWQKKMFDAALTALHRPEKWVYRQVVCDFAYAQAEWDQRGGELEEIARSYPYPWEFM